MKNYREGNIGTLREFHESDRKTREVKAKMSD